MNNIKRKWHPTKLTTYNIKKINNTPLGLDQLILKVKNQPTFGFVAKCKPKVCSLALKKKDGNFRMGLSWYHKCEFEVKSIWTNQEKKWLMQIETKMVHKQNHERHHHDSPCLEIQKSHHSHDILCDWWWIFYWHGKISHSEFLEFFWFFQICELIIIA